MPIINKSETNDLPQSTEIHSRGLEAIAKVLSQSEAIKIPVSVKLGNALTGALFVPDTGNSRVYITGRGDEPKLLGSIPAVNIPKEFLRSGQPIEVRQSTNGEYKYVGIDTNTGATFNEGTTDTPDQSAVTQSQLDFASLQPYSDLTAVVKGAIYGDYAVKDLVTADFATSPLDTSAAAIDVPTTPNRAIGVLVQLNPSTSVLSYKQSSEFNAGLSLSAAYELGLLPLRDTGLWRVGYLKLSTGIAQFDYASVWTCAEFFPEQAGITGSTGATSDRVLVSDGTGGSTLKASGVGVDTSQRMSNAIISGGATYLNRIAIDSTVTDKTLSGNLLTPSTARYIRVSSQTGAASLDQIDNIATTNMTTGEEIILIANTNHFIDIRHNIAGGNIRLTSGTSLRLREDVGLRMVLNPSGIFEENLYTLSSISTPIAIADGGTGQTTQTAAFDALSPTTTKGDVIVDNGTNAVRLAVGANGRILVANSAATEGVEWVLRGVYAILREEQSTGTNGGSSSATTWNNRVINTEVYDPYSIVSISSNQFTPIAGDYKLDVWATAGHASTSTRHRLRLYNVTGTSVVSNGLSAGASGTANERQMVHLVCNFTANGTDAYRIDHYTSTAQATTGLGVNVGDGANEVFLELTLTKVG